MSKPTYPAYDFRQEQARALVLAVYGLFHVSGDAEGALGSHIDEADIRALDYLAQGVADQVKEAEQEIEDLREQLAEARGLQERPAAA